ncbi:MAG: hypothetical protein AAGF71_04545 [Pseudomonadota bacterium]
MAILVVVAAFWGPSNLCASEPGRNWVTGLSVSAGSMTEGSWEQALGLESGFKLSKPRLLSLGLWAERPVLSERTVLGVEFNGLYHSDGKDSFVEISLPVIARYRAIDPWLPIQGAAFGLGVSWASEIPPLEIERKGDSAQLLIHWLAEVELGRPQWRYTPFLRLHHRSDAWGVVDVDTGSNGFLLGLRLAF